MDHKMKTHTCSKCGKEFSNVELTAFDGASLCPDCLESTTVCCQDCGMRMWRDDNAGTDEHPLCESCRLEDYTTCTRCGRLVRNGHLYYVDEDDDYGYCESCYTIAKDRSIKSYSYKPEPIFFGDGPKYLGVELEIDGGTEDCDNANEILRIGNREGKHIYCKHDGSLNDGFEIVTHPMSLHYHLHHMPWCEILEKAKDMGYTSHQARTCGLHVHVNRATFGKDRDAQEEAIARVLYFVEKHWNELLVFSRRTQQQLDRWAARYGYKDQPQEMMEHVKKGYGNRYTCINLTNADTIEFRIFRGTLKLNTLIATLQMVSHICDVAIALPDEELRNLSWSQFVAALGEPELVQYLKERRLYVNRPVLESEVEI